MKIRVPPAALKVLKPLAAESARAGAPLYAVGGCVRDWLLRRPVFDLDVTVVGDPDPAADLAGRLLGAKPEPFGRFGTRRVVGRGRFRVDVATTRAETYAAPAALPEVTATRVPIEQDLLRRDFTINALAVRLDDGSLELVDPYGGVKDLKAKLVRVLHPRSFEDDPTRVLRAARFLARLKCRPAPGMKAMAVAALPHAAKLSPHRLGHELVVLLGEKDPGPALRILKAWGYLPLLHPDLAWHARMPRGVDARLAALAVALGPGKGRDFIDRFPHEHRLRARLHAALDLTFSPLAPRSTPDPLSVATARRLFPRLPPAALKACFLQGRDLIAAGLSPGPEFHRILEEAARLQRAGRLPSRPAALAWLKKVN